MKKTTLFLSICACAAFTFGSVVSASPLKNYDAGKIAVDAGVTLPTSIKGGDYKMSKSDSVYLGGTVGLGSNTALNYKLNNYKAEGNKTRAQQVNLMYKLLPGVSAYAGYVNADTKYEGYKNTQNSGQFGLSAAYDIPFLFTVWGDVGVGTKNSGYEIGISKPIFNNLELNASYYDKRFKDALPQKNALKAKGVNLGLTFKF